MNQTSEWYNVEFIGGPLCGTRPVHPTMNFILYVPENPEGCYYLYQNQYHWIPKCSEQANTTSCAPTCASTPKPKARFFWLSAGLKAVGSVCKQIWKQP